VSRRIEEWTPKYREFTTRFHRRFLAFGTGNNKGFLDDDTGERRWLPLEVGTVDLAGVRAVRDQLWAEGIVRFRANGVEWQDAQRLAAQVHAEFKVVDPWLEAVREWLERDDMDGGKRADGHVRVLSVLVSCLGLSLREITRKDELRVGKVLVMLGYQKANRRVDGAQTTVWLRAENSTVTERAENSAFSDLA
jgi:predicted P-loop ATPase